MSGLEVAIVIAFLLAFIAGGVLFVILMVRIFRGF